MAIFLIYSYMVEFNVWFYWIGTSEVEVVYIFVYHGCEISKISYDKQTFREQNKHSKWLSGFTTWQSFKVI